MHALGLAKNLLKIKDLQYRFCIGGLFNLQWIVRTSFKLLFSYLKPNIINNKRNNHGFIV